MQKSISIAGAGIAGLASAVLLAEDHKVDVFERNQFIGKAGGEDIEAVRNYGMQQDQFKFFEDHGIKLGGYRPINKIIKFAPSGKKMEVTSDKGPLFYSFKRGAGTEALEYQLFEQAVDKGVMFNFNSRKSLSSVDIVSAGAIFRNIWAYGALFKGVNVNEDTILFFLNNDYCPQGYIYMIPYGKHEIAIAATTYDLSCPLPILFNKFLKENEIISKILEGSVFVHNIAGYAYSNVPESAEVKGIKFVGGSAGFVDAARGYGVKYAIESGIYAAEAIKNNTSYDSLWKTAFEPELVDGLKRRVLIEKLTNEDYEKSIEEEQIKIKKYKKVPTYLMEVYQDIKSEMILNDYRQRYSLQKLFER